MKSFHRFSPLACSLAIGFAMIAGLAGPASAACPDPNTPPAFTAPTPECGSVLGVLVGAPVTFTLRATDPDEGDSVRVLVTGLPPGATLTPALPDSGDSVRTVFAWTPAAADTGDHVIAFQAIDDCGAAQACSLTVRVIDNRPPDCSAAYVSRDELWPPNHQLVPVEIHGVTDPDGDPIKIIVNHVTQDEAVSGGGSGGTCSDAVIVDGAAQLRAERSGQGNGRVYRLHFTAADDVGGACEGWVTVCVPHDNGNGNGNGHGGRGSCVDDGQQYTSIIAGCDTLDVDDDEPKLRVVHAAGGVAQIAWSLPVEAEMTLAVYDVAGRRIATVAQGRRPAGEGSATWTVAKPGRTVYFVQLRAGEKSVAKRIFFMR